MLNPPPVTSLRTFPPLSPAPSRLSPPNPTTGEDRILQQLGTSYRDALDPGPQVRALGTSQTGGLRSGGLDLALLTGDILLWIGIYSMCLWSLHIFGHGFNLPNSSVVGIPLGISLLSAWLVDAYDRDSNLRSLRFASEFLLAGFFATVVGAGLLALFGSYGSTRMTSRVLLLATPLGFTLISLYWRRVLAGRSEWDSNGVRRVLLLGSVNEAAALQRALEFAGRPAAVERLDPAETSPAVLSDYLRTRATAPASADSASPGSVPLGAIVLGLSADPLHTDLPPFLVSLHTTRLPVYTWPAFWRLRVRMHDVHDPSTAWLFDRDFRLVTTSVYWHVKRMVDLVLAAAALVLTTPILLLAAIAIRLDSNGPAFFRQQRVGFRGKRFAIYKFRTMRVNSEADGTTTAPGDTRITRLGHFLRRSRVDEIPQLLNVLKGDMSFVGPRPEWTVCVEHYEQHLCYYHLRHLAKPGITGWAQVNYPYGQDVNDARNKLSFDLYYVTHASLLLDCSILLKTLYVVLGRIGGH
ncbi:MAG: exopolysaccharide biosynthesis polyprenyl glycosylphosphotransferase [Verrucomicrobiota bacterium]